jgi:hypothetical protein
VALLSLTIVNALDGPTETTITQLLHEYGYSGGDNLLIGLSAISDLMNEHGLRCEPPLGSGGLDTPRILSSIRASSLAGVLAEIAGGETAEVEFKSSLLVDRKKLEVAPGKCAAEYKSDAVIRSSLKTIVAFANSGGGTLYVGVTDNGEFCGLAEDFAAANAARSDYDGWDLHFRNLITSRISDGAAMNRYVQAACYVLDDGRCFVRVKVAARRRLTFLKSGEVWELFMRSGTQTNSIPYVDIEHHFHMVALY